MERTKEGQRRKEWSKKHGHDTYGNDDNLERQSQKYPSRSSWRKNRVGESASVVLQLTNAPTTETAL